MADKPGEGMGEGQPSHEPGQRQKVKFTVEEMKVLKECNTESFWYRCVPLGIVFISTTQMLVMRGSLKPHPKYGALLKNFGAGFCAFVVGKMSYQSKCREKILRLENSPLAESIRRGRNWTDGMRDASVAVDGMEPYSSATEAEPGARQQMHRSDGSSMEQKGLDESMRPSMDRDKFSRVEPAGSDSPHQTFDQLRAQNRREFDRKGTAAPAPLLSGGVRVSPSGSPGSSEGEVSGDSRTSDQKNQKPIKRNKYGDPIET